MRSSIHIKGLAALILALSVFTSVSVFAQGRKAQKIEFSEPSSSSIVVSNLDLETSESKLKPLPKPIYRPSDLFEPKDNMSIPMRPPMLQPRLDKKTIEALEKRRNWAFTDYEAIYSDKTAESIFGLKGDTKNVNKSKTPAEKYYESLDQKRKLGTSPLNEILDLNQARTFALTNGMPGVGRSQTENDIMTKVFAPAYENPFAPKQSGSVATFATPNYINPSQDASQRQQAEFRKMLSQASASPVSPALANQSAFGSKPNSGLNSPGLNPPGWANTATPAEQPRNLLNPFLGVAKAPEFRPDILRDPTAKALGLPDPSQLPKYEEKKKTPPPSPLANPLPVRKF